MFPESMTHTPTIPIFDAHLDIALNALHYNRDMTLELEALADAELDLFDTPFRTRPTVSFPELKRARVMATVATVIARHKPGSHPIKRSSIDYATPQQAFAASQAQLAWYRQMEREGIIRILESANSLRAHWHQVKSDSDPETSIPLGMILSMESADSIVAPEQASLWYDQGLRVIGLAHYGPHPYAFGTGSDGPLPQQGKDLLHELDRLGMILDLTHTTDTCFFSALEHFEGPILASHNNCRTIVTGDRQMSDEQLTAIIQRGGVVGVAFDSWMLKSGYTFTRGSERLTHPRHDPKRTPREATTIANVADHIDHICQLAGNDQHVGIGSDLDGGFGTEQCPADLNSIADLQKLAHILSSRNYSDSSIHHIFHNNWLQYFLRHLG